MDRRTIEELGVPSLELMERAGRGVVRALLARIPKLWARRIVIVCGKGNNGGDGLVVARLLRERGLWPRVILTADRSELSPDAEANAAAAARASLVLESGDPASSLSRLSSEDLVLDALLGTGLEGPARGVAAEWIEAINRSAARTIAIDIPSGLASDHGRLLGAAVEAELTISMSAPKLGCLFPPARRHWGECIVVDIGIPSGVEDAVGPAGRFVGPEEMRALLPHPGQSSHKGDWGKVVLVGGSPGMTGAPVLAAKAALRTGAGLVRVAVPRSLATVFATRLEEAMTIPLPEGEDGQPLSQGADRILSGFGDWDALVVGPGLGRTPEAERLVLKLLGKWRGPMLLDADALNALAAWGADSWVPRAREIRAGGMPGGLVLTPHLGEMHRLSGVKLEELQADPVAAARAWSARWGVTLVLKGAPTVIAGPGGDLWVNPTGNSGLATGGSGDVLSGVIGALLGQGLTGTSAALLGCYLHGLAADLRVDAATTPFAQRSLLPSDVVDALPAAIRFTEEGRATGRQRIWRLM